MPVSGDGDPVKFTRGSARKIAAHLRKHAGDGGGGPAERRHVRGGPRMPKLARATGAVSSQTEGTFAVYQGNPGGSESASGESRQAFNYGSDIPNNTWVLLHHNGFAWYVLDRFGAVDLAVFYLNENLPQFGSASAQISEWSGAAWVPNGDPAITVYDVCGSGPADLQSFGIAWLAPSGRWEIIELAAQQTFFYPFYLNEYLPKGGEASATICLPTNGLGDLWPPDGIDVVVRDVAGRFGPAGPQKRGIAARVVVDNDPDHDIYLVFSLDESKICWAKATSHWTKVTGMNASYVDCVLVTDMGGGTTIDDDEAAPITVRVYLPSDDANKIHPNVRSGMVIAFNYDDNGVAFCISDCGDDPIDTVKMWDTSNAPLRGGWIEFTAMAARFPAGVGAGDSHWDPSARGNTGGNSHHDHDPHVFTVTGEFEGDASGTATLSGGGLSGTGTVPTSTDTTLISIANHFDHQHKFGVTARTVQSGSGATVHEPTTIIGGETFTSGVQILGSSGNLAHSITDNGHDHSIDVEDIIALVSLTGTVELTDITVTGELTMDEETLTHSDEGHINPYYAIYFIKRTA